MKIKITGGSGFVGSNLVPFLERNNYSVDKINREELNGVTALHLQGIYCIVHLAGKAHDLKNLSDAKEYYDVNFELTKKVFDAFLVSDAVKFIFLSSVKAVADVVEDSLTENDVPKPKTDYGKSKLMAEDYILKQQIPHNKQVYILRPCMIHGPNNKGNLNLLFGLVKKKIPYPLAAYNNKRSFLSIDNLLFVIEKLISKDIENGIYNVADDEPISTTELVGILAESLGQKASFIKIPSKVVEFFAKVGDVFHLPMNTHRLTKLTENYVVSNKKIIKVLGINMPINVREGLAITAKSFINQYQKNKDVK